jgi:hypothetical protein
MGNPKEDKQPHKGAGGQRDPKEDKQPSEKGSRQRNPKEDKQPPKEGGQRTITEKGCDSKNDLSAAGFGCIQPYSL